MSNLFKQKLAVANLGVFFLTGAPVHIGHFDAIVRAKREQDACLVVVSGRKGDRGDQVGLDLIKRFRYLRELFADEENVFVAMLNEDDIPAYPNGWTPWMKKMRQIIADSTSSVEHITWYVGEAIYKEELESRTPDSVILLDRSILPVSGTQVRDNPLKYWDAIVRTFRGHFSTNILIAGSASGGKTTLTRDLAKSFSSPFTEEYARLYEEESNIRDEELTANDFHYFASGQFASNKKAIKSPGNNGLFFADTNTTVTKMYSEHYLTEAEHAALLPVYNMLIAKEKWDLILVIPPVTPYVDDHFRDMSYSDNDSRWKMHNRLMELLIEQGLEDKIVLLDAPFNGKSTDDKKGFYARYEQARRAVKQYAFDTYHIHLN